MKIVNFEELVRCNMSDVKEALPFWGHEEGETSFDKGNYIEIINLLKRCDPVLEEHFDSATLFKVTSRDIQKDLISAIIEVVNQVVSLEFKEAITFSIMRHFKLKLDRYLPFWDN